MYVFQHNQLLLFLVLLIAGSTAYALGIHWLRFYQPPRRAVWLFLILVVPLGIVAAHVAFALINSRSPAAWPAFFLSVQGWRSGYASIGGAAAALLALALTALIQRHRIVPLLDQFAPLAFITIAMLRVVCLVNGCCHGRPTDLPWAMRFPSAGLPEGLTPPSHPAQLYAIAANLLIYLLLPQLIKRLGWRAGSGLLALACLALYSLQRSAVEFLRLGATSQVACCGLSLTQLILLPAAVVAITGIVVLSRAEARRPASDAGGSTEPD